MSNLINSFLKFPAAAGGDLVKVSVYNGDETDCCTGGFSATNVLVDDAFSGAGLDPSVNDVISVEIDGSVECAIVTAINQGGSSGSNYTYGGGYSDCDECYNYEGLCFGEFCLLPEMLVKVTGGALVKVIDLEVGDLIEGPDGFTQVIKLIKDHPRNHYYIIEDELYITSDHPMVVDGEIIRAEDYPGKKKLVQLFTNTVYVGTIGTNFNVYCANNVYVVDGQYHKK